MRIRYKDFVNKAMPKDKIASNKVDIISYFLRPIAHICSMPLVKMGISATTVTKFSLLFPLLAFCFFAFMPNTTGFLCGWVSIFIWDVLDGIDGDIARYTNTCSAKGELWDATVGWIAIMMFYIGMGFSAFYSAGTERCLQNVPDFIFLVLGFITAIFNIFPRLVMHKKSSLVGKEAVRDLQDRSHFSLLKIIVFNLNSINGFAFYIFFIAYFMNLTGACMIFYFLLNAAICIFSMCNLLK